VQRLHLASASSHPARFACSRRRKRGTAKELHRKVWRVQSHGGELCDAFTARVHTPRSHAAAAEDEHGFTCVTRSHTRSHTDFTPRPSPHAHTRVHTQTELKTRKVHLKELHRKV
jgi:hypothetical protein